MLGAPRPETPCTLNTIIGKGYIRYSDSREITEVWKVLEQKVAKETKGSQTQAPGYTQTAQTLAVLQNKPFRPNFAPFVFFCSKTSSNPPVCTKLGRVSFHLRSLEGRRTEGREGNKGFPDSSSGLHADCANFCSSSEQAIQAQLCSLRFLLFKNLFQSPCLCQTRSSKLPLQKFRRRLNRR